MRERDKASVRLPEARTPEGVFSIMATQSALGLCYTIELLDLAEADRQVLLDLLTGVEQTIKGKKSEMGSVIGGSVIDLTQRVHTGNLDRSVGHEKLVKAMIGLARSAQILNGQVTPETESGLLNLCQELHLLARQNGIIVGNSTLELIKEVLVNQA